MEHAIESFNKGLGTIVASLEPANIKAQNWRLLGEDLSLPTAVLYEQRLAHNLSWMQQFIEAYGVNLAPHGKTTMAPKLFKRQLEAGAWGITLATAPQTKAACEHGVRRVLLANQLVGKQNMAVISQLLEDPRFEFYCLVDSPENVSALGEFFEKRAQRLNVLVEVGMEGGRAGIRSTAQLEDLLYALKSKHDSLSLCGVELYEGVFREEPLVRQFLEGALEVARELARGHRFDRHPFILSGAGSSWYDLVADIFSEAKFDLPVEIVLRPGCYLTHDVGTYRATAERIQNNNPIAQRIGSSLLPALHLWAYVQSIPEKNLAIVGLGKRDASFDAGFPVPALHYRPGTQNPTLAPKEWELTKIMDQHAFLSISEGDNIRVGDMIAFDICHPCLTFDKWRYLPILDEDYRVIDIVATYF